MAIIQCKVLPDDCVCVFILLQHWKWSWWSWVLTPWSAGCTLSSHQQWMQRHLVKECRKFIWVLRKGWHNELRCPERWTGSRFRSTFCDLSEPVVRVLYSETVVVRIQGSEAGGKTERKREIAAVSVDGSSITPRHSHWLITSAWDHNMFCRQITSSLKLW